MLRGMGLVLGAFVLWAAPAQGASVSWHQTEGGSWNHISVHESGTEETDMVVRGEEGTHLQPNVVTVVDRAGTMTSGVPTPPPGACDEGAACSVPCRIETPRRARCVFADGFTRDPLRDNPLKPPGFRYVLLSLATGVRNRITVPDDNPVEFQMSADTMGPTVWNISHAKVTIETHHPGNVIRSGPGGRIAAWLFAPTRLDTRNGSFDDIVCPTVTEPWEHTMRIDVFDDTRGDCHGDISPTPEDPPVPAPPHHPYELLP
jgi:hypothetical protein